MQKPELTPRIDVNLPQVKFAANIQGRGLDRAVVMNPSALPLSSEEAAWLQEKRRITVLIDARHEPVSFTTPQGKPVGLAVDVLQQISERFGLQMQYEIAQNNDQLTALFVQYPDAVLAGTLTLPGETEAAPSSLTQSRPWLLTPSVVVMKRSTLQPTSLHDLMNEKVAISRDNPLIPWINTWFPTLQLILTDTLHEALQRVNSGEAYAAMGAQFSAQYHLAGDPFRQLHLSLSLPVKPYHVGFASLNGHSPALALLNNALQHLPPEQLQNAISSWQETRYSPDTGAEDAFTPLLVGFTLLAAGIVILLMSGWIGRRCQSLKMLRERLKSHQMLIEQLQQASVTEVDSPVWADTGVSLAACQRMAQAEGAALSVESAPEVSDRLSLHFSATPVKPGEFYTERTHLQHPMKVLIVDDYPPARLLLSQQLRKANCEVLPAADGKQGLSLWQQYSAEIGLIITDCTMPEMDGFAMSRTIRDLERSRQLSPTPIYALTALNHYDIAEDCVNAGINACFTKPITSAALNPLLANCAINNQHAE